MNIFEAVVVKVEDCDFTEIIEKTGLFLARNSQAARDDVLVRIMRENKELSPSDVFVVVRHFG